MSTSLIYTLGRRDIYDPYIASDLSAAKAVGGSVWRTYEKARLYQISHSDPYNDLKEYDIYGVVADWDRDTIEDSQALGATWRVLTKNAYLIAL